MQFRNLPITNTYLHEFRDGGEMLEKLKVAERYNETDAANTVHKIVDALVYIHSKGIAHRDLKVRLPLYRLSHVCPTCALQSDQRCLTLPILDQPENLLLTHGDDTVKIVDFGFAKVRVTVPSTLQPPVCLTYECPITCVVCCHSCSQRSRTRYR